MTRRSAGEGSIYQRANGRYYAELQLGFDGGGRRLKKTFSAKTQKEVVARLREAQSNLRRGMQPVTDRHTTAEYLNGWIATRRGKVRDNTWRRYSSLIETHVIPAIGHVALTRLTAADVDAMTSGVQERRSAQTAAHARRVLIGALNKAVRDRLIRYNVAAESEPVRVNRPKIDGTSPEQARVIVAAFTDHPLESLVALALDSGARLGELLALRWRDMDFDEPLMRIERTWQRDRFEQPKTARSRRTVDLHARTVALLRRQPTPIDRDSLVFGQRDGRPLHGSAVTREFQAVLKRRGIPSMRFHDLRHACATLMLAAGVPVHVVSERLGHRDERITLTVYSHVIPVQRRDAADRLGVLLYGAV